MPDGALYWYGNECKFVTGGWFGRDQWDKTGGGSLTKKSSSMSVYGSSSTWSYMAMTTKNFDTIDFSKLCAMVKASATNSQITLRLTQDAYSDSNATYIGSFSNTYSIRKGQLLDHQKRYLGAMAYSGTTLEVEAIWLE